MNVGQIIADMWIEIAKENWGIIAIIFALLILNEIVKARKSHKFKRTSKGHNFVMITDDRSCYECGHYDECENSIYDEVCDDYE